MWNLLLKCSFHLDLSSYLVFSANGLVWMSWKVVLAFSARFLLISLICSPILVIFSSKVCSWASVVKSDGHRTLHAVPGGPRRDHELRRTYPSRRRKPAPAPQWRDTVSSWPSLWDKKREIGLYFRANVFFIDHNGKKHSFCLAFSFFNAPGHVSTSAMGQFPWRQERPTFTQVYENTL